MIFSLCDTVEVLSVLKIVNIMITIIKIGAPIALIVSLSLELLKAISSHDQDAIKKAEKMAVNKCIAAILIIIFPSLIAATVNVIGGENTYQTCMNNATEENIQVAYVAKAERLMDLAVEKSSFSTYTMAKMVVNHLSDQEVKQKYLKELEEVKKIIDAKDAIAKVRRTKKEEDYQKAAEAIELIEDETVKEELNEELIEIAKTMKNYASEFSSDGAVANVLGLPYYNQCDGRWGNINYDTGGATLCSSSCGYTSYSMIAAGMSSDFSITPYTIVEYFRAPLPTSRGYGAASWDELCNNSKAAKFGMKAEWLFSSGESKATKISLVESAINSGSAVIILRPGHYIVAVGNGSGSAILLDPGWSSNNGTYTVSQLWNKMEYDTNTRTSYSGSPAFEQACKFTKIK